MSFPVACGCGQRFMAEERLAGTRVRCPACGGQLFVKKPAVQAAEDSKLVVSCTCGKSYAASVEQQGQDLECPACGSVMIVPLAGQGSGNKLNEMVIPSIELDYGFRPITSYNAVHRPTPTANPFYPSHMSAAPRTTNSNASGTKGLIIGLSIGGGIATILIFLIVILVVVKNFEVAQNPPVVAPDKSVKGITSPLPVSSPSPTVDRPTTSVMPSIPQVPQPSGFPNAAPNPTMSLQPTPFQPSSPFLPPTNPSQDFIPPTIPLSPFSAGPMPSTGFPSRPPRSDLASSAVEKLASEPAEQKNPDIELPRFQEGLGKWYEASGTLHGLRKVGDSKSPLAHYSWMVGLLPSLGHQKIYDGYDFSKPWSDEKNLQLSVNVIPQFLDPNDKRQRWKGYPLHGMGLTHFVGMSGVEDKRNVVAASLPRSDPRSGVFSYDEIVKSTDIADGASQTIMLIGSGELASPWMMGGGATIRGAREPYFSKIGSFGSVSGKTQGAITVFADGSVRHVSASVDPKVFRAMCTTHGAETFDLSAIGPIHELENHKLRVEHPEPSRRKKRTRP